MNGIALFWIILFAVSALMFFGIAAVITVVGFRDLRVLLTKSGKVTRVTDDSATPPQP